MPRASVPLSHFLFTLNNYEEEEYSSITSWLEQEAKYWIIGREVGESGTPHLQGYASLKRRRTFDAVKHKLSSRAHIERANGTARENRRYCSKDGDFVEGGSINEGGKSSSRNELAESFVVAVRSGNKGVAEFATSFPGTYIYSGLGMLRNALSLYPPVVRPSINVRWIYGPPGVGKSKRAHEELKEAYIKDPRTKWWNGYMMETEVIIDDFGPNGIDINHLLRWFDYYKCLVETKGGMVALYATTFIVTSNFHPRDVFNKYVSDHMNHTEMEHPQLPALLRRVSLISMS